MFLKSGLVTMETDAQPVQVGNAIIRHARHHTEENALSYLPCQPPQVSNLLAASDAHPFRVLDDLRQRPLSVGWGVGGRAHDHGRKYIHRSTATQQRGAKVSDPHINAKRPTKPAQQKSDLSQRRRDRVHGSEPGQGRWLIRAAQHHGVPGVRGVQLQLSEGGDKKN